MLPSKYYYLAVSLLNSKNVFDWAKAVDMLNDKELQFVRYAFGVEDKFEFIKDKDKDGLWFNNKFWRISSKAEDILVSTDAEVFQIIEFVKETKEKLVVRVNRRDMRIDTKSKKLCFTRNSKIMLLHRLVFETFIANTNDHVRFKDGNIYNCKLENLYANTGMSRKTEIRKDITKYKLYKHKDEIKHLRYDKKMGYNAISKLYGVGERTVKYFLLRLGEEENCDENVQPKKIKQAV